MTQANAASDLDAEKNKPAIDTAEPDENQSQVDFDAIRKVVEKARRVAFEDYHFHLNAVMQAVTDEDRATGLERLSASDKAFRLTDSAYTSLISAEADFRKTTLSLLKGEQASAEKHALFSKAKLNQVADNLSDYSENAHQSKFYTAAINAVAKVDRMAGKLETSFVMTAHEFSAGLKSFAERIGKFASAVAQYPSKIAHLVETTAVTAYQAIKATNLKFMTGVKSTAWTIMKESTALANRTKQHASDAVDTVTRHGAAAKGVASNVMKSIVSAGKSLAENYEKELDKVDQARAAHQVERSRA